MDATLYSQLRHVSLAPSEVAFKLTSIPKMLSILCDDDEDDDDNGDDNDFLRSLRKTRELKMERTSVMRMSLLG